MEKVSLQSLQTLEKLIHKVISNELGLPTVIEFDSVWADLGRSLEEFDLKNPVEQEIEDKEGSVFFFGNPIIYY